MATRAIEKLAGLLDVLDDGTVVAVVSMLGSLCPVHLGHVECLEASRRMLLDRAQEPRRRPDPATALGEGTPRRADAAPALQSLRQSPPWVVASSAVECVGALMLNGDGYVGHKMRQAGDTALTLDERIELVELATEELPWLVCWDGWSLVDSLCKRWPSLRFVPYTVNGADDVVKHHKWGLASPNDRYITILRAGSNQQLHDALRNANVPLTGTSNFVLGPEVADRSSTAVRAAARRGDREALLGLVHPLVAARLLARAAGNVVLIGDIHGNIAELRALWAKLEAKLGAAGLWAASVVFLGDYCDRGPDTKGVLDWLIDLEQARAKPGPGTPAGSSDVSGGTHFIAGNHDFAMACYLGCLPIDGDPGLDLDSTVNPIYTSGYFAHDVPGGMHYQGRRWGGSNTYNADATFASYGVKFRFTPEARAKLIAAVPARHREFLARLKWVHQQPLGFPPGRLVCAHAGLDPTAPLEPQLVALAARDLGAAVLHERGDTSRITAFVGREEVVPAHPEQPDMYLVSGHHGFSVVKPNQNRVIIDASGGRPGPSCPLQAIVLPSREIISVP